MIFPHLFSPLRIGPVTVPNRILMAPMHTSLGRVEHGLSDAAVDFYLARARGGFGLIGVGVIDAHPFEWSSPLELLLSHRDHLPAHRRVVEGCHAAGSVPFAQVGVRRLWPIREMRKLPRLSTVPTDLVQSMVEAMVRSCVLAREAGYPAVEVQGNGGGAVSIFLSPRFNDRDDEWGGDFERRLRFPLAVIEGIRRECGPDYPIFFRLLGGEFAPGGFSTGGARRIARALAAAGVCCFNVTGGSHATRAPQLTPNVPRGSYAFLARDLRHDLRGQAAVAAANRITDPHGAESILRRGWADLVSLGRQALADPDWPNKVRSGRLEDIRLCVACNECLDSAAVFETTVYCLVNPRVSRPPEAAPLPRAAAPKRVLVVGGGCTGLQAALTCAERGHRVDLYEKEPYLGGKWQVACAPPGREELAHFLTWLVRQCQKAGVTLHTGVEVTPDLVRAAAPDAVFVCAGGRPRVPDLPGVDLPHVVTAQQVLMGAAEVGERVVVIGGGGVGVETALYLARRWEHHPALEPLFANAGVLDDEVRASLGRRGHQVTLVGRNRRVGVGLGPGTKWVLVEELRHAGVQVLAPVAAREIRPDAVRVAGPEGEQWLPADTVVLAVGYEPTGTLYEAVKDLAPAVHMVGDAADVQHAIQGIGRAFELALQV